MSIIQGGLVTQVEKPTGTVDGVNDTFTTSRPYIAGTLLVFVNGLAMTPGVSDDYQEVDSTTFQFNTDAIPDTEGSYTDKLLVLFQIA